MSLIDFKNEIENDVTSCVSSEMKVIITETNFVPTVDDSAITNPNFETKEQKCKLIETCILYVDMRASTDISNSHRRTTLSKLYTTFVRSMVKCAEYFGGHVRGIIGDRVMVVFDRDKCFEKALDTAILMNSVTQYVINKKFNLNDVQAGIGIDYGKMLVTKAGIIKQGSNNPYYKSLVWLGRPANVASKLTDIANKMVYRQCKVVKEGYRYKSLDKWSWYDCDMDVFLNKLKTSYSPILTHPDEYFSTFFLSDTTSTNKPSRILFSKDVFDGLKHECPERQSVKEGWWYEQPNVTVSGYQDTIYGGDVSFSIFNP